MLHTLRPRMTMTKVHVQEQIGESYCGLFAIAFALVNGQDPAALTFDQAAMKKHLWLCWQRKQLEPFPTTKKLKFKNRVTGREVDTIYYLCRGIWVIEQHDVPVHAPNGTTKVAGCLQLTYLTILGSVSCALETLYNCLYYN